VASSRYDRIQCDAEQRNEPCGVRPWRIARTVASFVLSASVQWPSPAGLLDAATRVERRGAVAVGRTYLFPPLSSGGALVVRPCVPEFLRLPHCLQPLPKVLRGSAFPEGAALGLVVSVLIKRAHIARSKFRRTRGGHLFADVGEFEANLAATTERERLVKYRA
jgi:hypothetical protein